MDASVCPLRNLLITHHYQLIGGNMKSMLNVNQSQAASTQANWPSIAAWASNAVGNNIRNETLQYLVREIFRGWPQALVDALLKVAGGVDTWDFVRKLLAQMGRGLCEGNRVVFHEVGGAFAAFGVAFDALAQPDAQKLAAYLAMFDPKTAQQLADAMQQYYAAMWEADVGVRAQRIAWANWLVGLHEQTILQQYIVEVGLFEQ